MNGAGQACTPEGRIGGNYMRVAGQICYFSPQVPLLLTLAEQSGTNRWAQQSSSGKHDGVNDSV